MRKISILAALLAVTGCQESLTRSDLVESSAGNAKQSAITMQTIDPWQRYVYDTDLETSSQRQAIARNKYENGGVLPKKDPVGQPVYPFPISPGSGSNIPVQSGS